MRETARPGLLPGVSVLGGAGAGFSYEAALRDALARRAGGQQQAGQAGMPPQQTQSMPSERAVAQQRRQQG